MKELKDWLGPIADVLIPAEREMPSATAAGVADAQLEQVLGARPDLERHLRRAQALTRGTPPEQVPDLLADLDPAAYDALTETVAGGYYANPDVRALLGYTGQVPVQVRVPDYPEYIAEGLLERVVERGPVYRGTGE